MANLVFDPATERTRYHARQAFLARQGALRYLILDGRSIAALVSNHAEAPGRWVPPAAWSAWHS